MKIVVTRESNLGYIKYNRMIIHLLVILFGISTWIGVNGIFVELPLLVSTAPEAWNLPAYIVIVTQSANVGPAIYTLLLKCKYKLNESSCILCLLTSQVLVMGLLMFFHNETTIINGEKYSLILFVSVFVNALVGCFSSVLFMPYLRDFDDSYIVSYFIGEGLSGVLPSVMALIQGIKERMECTRTALKNTTKSLSFNTSGLKFPVELYFLFLFLVLLLSFAAFIALQYSSFVKERKNLRNIIQVQLVGFKKQREFDPNDNINCINDMRNNVHILSKGEIKVSNRPPVVKANDLSVFGKTYLYVLIGVYCFFSNGFLPSIQSYSCLPYGYLAYQLSITCTQFINPIACFLTFWIMVSNIKVINCFSLICLIAGCYVTYVALLSPTPPLRESSIGVSLIVLSWIVLMGIISYIKLAVVSLLKSVSSTKALFNIGVVMQTGSASGAIISFVLINFTDFFKAYDSCSV